MSSTRKYEQGRWWSVTEFSEEWSPPSRLPEGVCFIAGQRELAPSTGRSHWQCVVHFSKKTRRRGVVALFSQSAHAELSRSAAADIYVEKEDTAVSGTRFRLGEPVLNRNSKQYWERQWGLARSGNWEDCDADVKIKYYNTLKKITFDFAEKPQNLLDVCGIWIYGPPGVGKSHTARDWYPNLFNKNLNKWWDGFKGEKQVLLDDVGCDHAKWIGWFLKIWADKYVFDGEVKGGTIKLRPHIIVVTSNYRVEELFGFDPILAEAINRRFYKVPILRRKN